MELEAGCINCGKCGCCPRIEKAVKGVTWETTEILDWKATNKQKVEPAYNPQDMSQAETPTDQWIAAALMG
jgi:hypothetical protein